MLKFEIKTLNIIIFKILAFLKIPEVNIILNKKMSGNTKKGNLGRGIKFSWLLIIYLYI